MSEKDIITKEMALNVTCQSCKFKPRNASHCEEYCETYLHILHLDQIYNVDDRLISANSLMGKLFVNSKGEMIPEHDCDNFPITLTIREVKDLIRNEPTAYNSSINLTFDQAWNKMRSDLKDTRVEELDGNIYSAWVANFACYLMDNAHLEHDEANKVARGLIDYAFTLNIDYDFVLNEDRSE